MCSKFVWFQLLSNFLVTFLSTNQFFEPSRGYPLGYIHIYIYISDFFLIDFLIFLNFLKVIYIRAGQR